VSIDASFISLQIILPVVKSWLEEENGLVVALIKPQFQAGQAEAARGEGVIRDPLVHRRVLNEVLEYAQNHGFCVEGLIRSPLFGPKGNTEFLTRLAVNQPAQKTAEAWTEPLFEGVL
jgi:23S rRNA (cytidine1920-2'-O)/16S rRNA (cytidine1409-2'-O)-methyltransferase